MPGWFLPAGRLRSAGAKRKGLHRNERLLSDLRAPTVPRRGTGAVRGLPGCQTRARLGRLSGPLAIPHRVRPDLLRPHWPIGAGLSCKGTSWGMYSVELGPSRHIGDVEEELKGATVRRLAASSYKGRRVSLSMLRPKPCTWTNAAELRCVHRRARVVGPTTRADSADL